MTTRLPLLLDTLRNAGRPLSGRAVSRLSGLPHAWTGSRGLPEAERRGLVRRTERGWDLVEPRSGTEA